MASRVKNHHRVRIAFVGITSLLLLALGALAWWAASKIDDRSMARETKAVGTGLEELLARIPVEQDSSAIWSDSVINLRANNDAWIAENLAEWLSEYFGHDRVYLVDPSGSVIRAVENGERVPLLTYERDRAAIDPMIALLQDEMAAAATATPQDSTAAITGLGIEDVRVLTPDRAAIVSIRPILPSNEAVIQAAGTEFLHVSVVEVGPEVARTIGTKFDIEDLRFTRAPVVDSDRISSPVLDRNGRIVGFFSWVPNEPAYQLVAETGPLIAGCALFLVLGGALLLIRLQRTAERLEDSEAQATFLAYHDSLTRLPNRAMFEGQLGLVLAAARRVGGRTVLHCIDLDHFKTVNDTLGHAGGDALLVQVAHRLGGLMGERDFVARLGGDEFAIIQAAVGDMRESLGLAQRVISVLEQPFDLGGHEVAISASIGIMSADGPETSAEDLLRQADLALYEAKAGGRGRYLLYGGELGAAVRDRLAMEIELREALRSNQQLHIVYQPIYCAQTNRILGAEALVRWQHPVRGSLSPAVFIRLAEERGLINQLGLWVMHQACEYAAATALPWVAVNVSPVQFRDERFAERVFDVLRATSLDPHRLEIEVTEGLLLQNSPEVQHTLRVLRNRGIRVALDDFGTGYSSISYLRTYGVDKLKIDQSFTAQLGLDDEIDSIVRSIIDLGTAMKMKLTAEGVETEQQRALLVEMGCDQLQGYLLSRPISGDKLNEKLAPLSAFDDSHVAILAAG